uniref:Pentacotripeptide-repeat region of PRORP domain-containing protein n=1 Tax=Oryza punctata TaxID=4537 RepID=A0A0E0MLN9_ORYPU
MGGDPTADPSSPYFIDADHPYAAAAASALTSHRSRSKWSHLSSLTVPDPLPASAVAAVPLLLRRRPHVALTFHLFATRRLLPSGSPPPLLLSVSAAHVAAASRLRRAAISVLSSAARHYPHSQIFAALAATYRRFASAPFVFDLLLLAYLRSRRDTLAAASPPLAPSPPPPPPSSAPSPPPRRPSTCTTKSTRARVQGSTANYCRPFIPSTPSSSLSTVKGSAMISRLCSRKWIDIHACTIIRMAAYCDIKEVEKARGLWDEMVEGGIQPDVAAYNTMISGYCGAGEVGTAEEMFKDMEMGGINPSVTTFEWLVRGHCRVGDIDAAMLVRADMSRRGFRMAAEVVEEVVNLLCQKKRVKEALDVLKEEMRKEEFVPSRECYEVLIRELCEQGEVEVAMRLQAEMAGMGFKAGSEVYCAFVCAYEKAEDYEMAEKLREELSANRRKERTILRRLCHFSEHNAACRRLVHRVAHRKENVQVDQSALKSDAISMSKEELSKT